MRSFFKRISAAVCAGILSAAPFSSMPVSAAEEAPVPVEPICDYYDPDGSEYLSVILPENEYAAVEIMQYSEVYGERDVYRCTSENADNSVLFFPLEPGNYLLSVIMETVKDSASVQGGSVMFTVGEDSAYRCTLTLETVSDDDPAMPELRQSEEGTAGNIIDFEIACKRYDRIRGDYNGDGELIALDAQLTLMAFAAAMTGDESAAPVSNAALAACDIDGDRELTAKDAQQIIIYYLESILGVQPKWPDDPTLFDEDFFVAHAKKDENSDAVIIEWFCSEQPDTFIVMQSDDNETFTELAAVSGATTYVYSGEPDSLKYIKVTYINETGECLETQPFGIQMTEDGFRTVLPDTDGDKIFDINEDYIGTDPLKADTDDDGLDDYTELVLTQTNPLIYDSVESGVPDPEADTDADGLSNQEELAGDTDPADADTDGDGLNDGDELNQYGTDPLKYDTDEDSLNDGFEVRNGLNPLAAETDGIADTARQLDQTIPADSTVLNAVNTESSPYTLSIDIRTNGNAEENLQAKKSGRSYSLANDAMIGMLTEITMDDVCTLEKLTLNYEIKDAYCENTLNKYSQYDDMKGIYRLCVFKYSENVNMMLPVKTEYDPANNIIRAEVAEPGIYCVMDLEVWFDLFDVEPEEIEAYLQQQAGPNTENLPQQQSAVLKSFAVPTDITPIYDTTPAYTPKRNWYPIDLVFILQTAGSPEAYDVYLRELDALETVVGYMFDHYSNVRVHVIHYDDKDAEALRFGTSSYTTNLTAFSNGVRALSFTTSTEFCPTRKAFEMVDRDLMLRSRVNTFIYHMHNGNNLYELDFDGIVLCNQHPGIFSQVLPEGYGFNNEEYPEMLNEAILRNNGINISLTSSVAQQIVSHIESLIDEKKERTEFDALIGATLKKVTLKAPLKPGSDTNSDSDSLTDWKEVNSQYIDYDNFTEQVTLPTLGKLLQFSGFPELFSFSTDEYSGKEAALQIIGYRPVLPCLSDPNSSDSDGDSFLDDQEEQPSIAFDYRFIRTNSLDDIPVIDFMNPVMLGYGNTKFNPAYGTPGVDGREKCYRIRGAKASDYKEYTFLSLGATAGHIPLITNLEGAVVFSDISVECNRAAKYLDEFLYNHRWVRKLSESDMREIISTCNKNTYHFMINMHAMMDLCESTVGDGQSAIFASNHEDNFKVCCYAGKHCEDSKCGLDVIPGSKGITDDGIDWSYAIGESFGSMAISVTRTGNTYTATAKYILTDYYEWGYHVDGGDDKQHMLHECGLAREYPIEGVLTMSFSWEKGERPKTALELEALMES